MATWKRILIMVWLGIFAWWCVEGASWLLAHRAHDEAAAWVRILSLPWLAMGLIAGGIAVIRPTWRLLWVFGLVCFAQILLVFTTW